MGDTVSSAGRREMGEIRLSWRRGWRIALRSNPLHGDPAAVLDCCTLAAAATAAGRLLEGSAQQQGRGYGGGLYTTAVLVQSNPCCWPYAHIKSGSEVAGRRTDYMLDHEPTRLIVNLTSWQVGYSK